MIANLQPELADDRPLFIIGSVRSGTTLTRNLLRRVPNFICPEETHFFRWAEPFRTPHSWQPHRNNMLLKRHRTMDGIDEETFESILAISRSKAELQRRYIAAFARAQGVTGPYRWFDKTPQNIYGAPLIAQQMPQARFVFMVRNPLNVVASMKLGRQVKISDLYGACNYWLEAAAIYETLNMAYRERVMCLRYEDLVADVPKLMAKIMSHIDLSAPSALFHDNDAHAEKNLWLSALTPAEAAEVRAQCGAVAATFGYDLNADLAAAGQAAQGTG
ncbi:sulfotransferase family protein [Roseicyclus sp.]|uniref:sulfotransferase family protein n=1 Tax=Roseicyclus sp. TaxID=1914329 RepID=UPI003F6C8F1E